MKRIVNTNSEEIIQREYPQLETHQHHKPSGLWYSIDGEWEDWVKSNTNWDVGKNKIRIDVDTSDMYVILTREDLLNFTKKYIVIEGGLRNIDWKRVAKDYKGIEIPYYIKRWGHVVDYDSNGLIHSNITDNLWYSMWDVSSGCIWDMSVIKNTVSDGE